MNITPTYYSYHGDGATHFNTNDTRI